MDALRVRAEQGNAEAQLLLGFVYGKGEGVPQDYAEAARLVRLAAEHGVAWAQAFLGEMYERGFGYAPRRYPVGRSMSCIRRAHVQVSQHRLLCARSKVLVYETMRDIARRMWDKWDLRLPRPPMSEVQPKPGRSAPGKDVPPGFSRRQGAESPRRRRFHELLVAEG